jgi:hypothetical protein
MKPTQTDRPRFRESPLGELLCGTAFAAHPGDPALSLSERFEGQPLLLALMAKDRCAILKLRFAGGSCEALGLAQQVMLRQPGELAAALAREAAEVQARWVVFSLATGWQAVLSSRSARACVPDDAFEGHRLLREQPDLFLSKPSPDFLYAAVDHPTLDRSLVFGVRRRDVEGHVAEAAKAGLRVASVRVGVAAMLEDWLARRGPQPFERDVLVSDGLSVLLLRFRDGDFMREGQGETASMPRQASTRPNDLAQDLSRLLRDNSGRPLSYVGPSELAPQVLAEAGGAATDESAPCEVSLLSLRESVHHELLPDVMRRRPSLKRSLKPVLSGCLAASALCLFAFVGLVFEAESVDADARLHAERLRQAGLRTAGVAERTASFEREQARGARLVGWLETHPHAQVFTLSLLSALPASVTLERIAMQLDEGGRQMLLECQLLGMEEAQLEAVRALERAVLTQGYRVGERHAPTPSQRGVMYKWRLILPLRGEESHP